MFREQTLVDTRRVKADMARAEAQISQLQEALESREVLLAAAARRENATALDHAKALAKVVADRDSALKERSAALSKAAQSLIEARRREKDCEKLEEKVKALLSDKRPRGAGSLSMAGTLALAADPDAAVTRAALQGELHDAMRRNLLAACEEIADLRLCVQTLHEAVQGLEQRAGVSHASEEDDEDVHAFHPSGDPARNDPTALPHNIGRSALAAAVNRDVKRLAALVESALRAHGKAEGENKGATKFLASGGKENNNASS